MTDHTIQLLIQQIEHLHETVRESNKIHAENHRELKEIRIQAENTNGRINNTEKTVGMLTKLSSEMSGLIVANQKRLEDHLLDAAGRTSYTKGVMKVVGIVGTVLLLAGGYFFTLAVKDVVNDNNVIIKQ